MNKSVVYVDSVLSATKESGDVIKSGATIYAEIGEIVLGSKKAEKTQRTVFKSLGLFHFLSGFILLCCNTLRIFFYGNRIGPGRCRISSSCLRCGFAKVVDFSLLNNKKSS